MFGGQLGCTCLGTLALEFTTWNATYLEDDCRTVGFGSANAAGLNYAIVETDHFSYSTGNMMPRTDEVTKLVDYYLLALQRARSQAVIEDESI